MCKLASPFSTVHRCANDLRLTCQVGQASSNPIDVEAPKLRCAYAQIMNACEHSTYLHAHTTQRKRNLLPGIIAVHYAAFAPDSFLITSAPIVPNSMRQAERSGGRKHRFVCEERVRSKCN